MNFFNFFNNTRTSEARRPATVNSTIPSKRAPLAEAVMRILDRVGTDTLSQLKVLTYLWRGSLDDSNAGFHEFFEAQKKTSILRLPERSPRASCTRIS
jgi:hypothetical protein